VFGVNSIAIYCMAELLESFIIRSLQTHLGKNLFLVAGPAFEPLLLGMATMLILWLILFWMYRRKLFLKI
jgi:predicted acyltransferase